MRWYVGSHAVLVGAELKLCLHRSCWIEEIRLDAFLVPLDAFEFWLDEFDTPFFHRDGDD